jgi:hypothetical protein
MFDPASSTGKVLLLVSLPYIFFAISLLWSKIASIVFEEGYQYSAELTAEEEFKRLSSYTGTGRSSAVNNRIATASSFYSFTLHSSNPDDKEAGDGGVSLYLLFLEFKSIIILILLALLYCNIDLGTTPTHTPQQTQEQFHFDRRDHDLQQELLQEFQCSQAVAAARFGARNNSVRHLDSNTTGTDLSSTNTSIDPTLPQQDSNNYSDFLAEQERIRAALGMSE